MRSQGVVGRGNCCLGTAYPLGKHEREKEIGFYFWKLCLLYYSFPEMDCLVYASPYQDVQLCGRQAMHGSG